MNRPRPTRKLAIGSLEMLDERIVPAATVLSAAQIAGIAADEVFVTRRAGEALGSIYTQLGNYVEAGSQGTFSATLSNEIYMSGMSVGVDITFQGGNLHTLIGQLQGIGMDVTATSATSTTSGIVEGYLPISQLAVVATNGYATTIAPVYKPDFGPTSTVTPNSGGGSASADETLVSNRGGEALGSLYTQYINYELAGAQGTFTSPISKEIYTSGTSVGVDIRFNGGDFDTLVSELEGIGMQVTALSTQDSIVEGYLPLVQLPVVASNGYVSGLSPVFKPDLG